jgi:hypothetical protein
MTFNQDDYVRRQLRRMKASDASGFTAKEAADRHNTDSGNTNISVTALMNWVTETQKALTNEKLDGVARARLGELLITTCRYLSEREANSRRVLNAATDSEKEG